VRLLLDTHIWLWSLLAPDRLTRRVTLALRAQSNELWLSPISIWETLVLVERGRLELDSDPVLWVREQLARVSFKEAPLNSDVAIESRAIDLPHRDPADRFLAATARVYELTLVTADERLLGAKGFSTLANR
jgi:PIN domain nuclease of toxin-antitoxin system